MDAPADARAVPHLRDAAGVEVETRVMTLVSRNLKTALLLAVISLTTFFGIIAKYWFLNGK
jgi:hypothetical protein